MTDQDLVLAKQAGDYVTKVYTPPVRSKTPGKIWEAGHVGWYTQFTAKFAALIRADERDTFIAFIQDYPHWLGDNAKREIISAIRARGNT